MRAPCLLQWGHPSAASMVGDIPPAAARCGTHVAQRNARLPLPPRFPVHDARFRRTTNTMTDTPPITLVSVQRGGLDKTCATVDLSALMPTAEDTDQPRPILVDTGPVASVRYDPVAREVGKDDAMVVLDPPRSMLDPCRTRADAPVAVGADRRRRRDGRRLCPGRMRMPFRAAPAWLRLERPAVIAGRHRPLT